MMLCTAKNLVSRSSACMSSFLYKLGRSEPHRTEYHAENYAGQTRRVDKGSDWNSSSSMCSRAELRLTAKKSKPGPAVSHKGRQ
jgi:hypothetical protein